MKNYLELQNGRLSIDGAGSIPTTHRFYTQALQEVANGAATIEAWAGSQRETDSIADKAASEIGAIISAIQQYMDSQAQLKGYDSIHTAVTYADEPEVPQFQNEGVIFRKWRSKVWAYGYFKLGQWQNGEIPEPTTQELIAGLPPLTF